MYRKTRPRPTAYRDADYGVSPYVVRPIVLDTGRGPTKITPAEAVALGLELFAVAAGLDPEAATPPRLTLALAERVAAQSELLAACASRQR